VVPVILDRVAQAARVGLTLLVVSEAQAALVVPVILDRVAQAARVGLTLLVVSEAQAVLLTQQVLQVLVGLIRTWEDQLRNRAL
jgi:hypothetical protein